MEKQRSQPCI